MTTTIPKETTHVRLDTPGGNTSTVAVADIDALKNESGRVTLLRKNKGGKYEVIDTFVSDNASDPTSWKKPSEVAATNPSAPVATTAAAPVKCDVIVAETITAAPLSPGAKAEQIQPVETATPPALPPVTSEQSAAATNSAESDNETVKTKTNKAKMKKAKKAKKSTATTDASSKAKKNGKTWFIFGLGNGKLTARQIAEKVVQKFPGKGSDEHQLKKALDFVRACSWHAKRQKVDFSYAPARGKK